MQWENLNSNDFAAAVKETGVCVLPVGVIERHSDHLPLGTDFLNVHRLAVLAAERESAVVFPPFYFGQIYEARCFPGTVTLKPTLLLELFFSVLDEIGRNGFKKILIINGHGGNNNLLNFLAQCSLWEEKSYALYVSTASLDEERRRQWLALCDTPHHGHAEEGETSVSLANHPQLVRMDRIPAEGVGDPLGRMKGLPFTGIGWYADYPTHYAGDAGTATAEKGHKMQELQVSYVAETIAAVKKDAAALSLQREFFRRAGGLRAD